MNAWDYLAAAVVLAAFLLVLGASLAGMGSAVLRRVRKLQIPIGAEPANGRSGLTSPAGPSGPRMSGNAAPPLEEETPPSTGGSAGPLTPGSLERLADNGWDFFFNEGQLCSLASSDHSDCRAARRDNDFDRVCDECRPVLVDDADWTYDR